MTLRVAQPCGCKQDAAMGQKREKVCEHRNLFERPGASRPRRGSTLKQGRGFQASPEQREKVEGQPCIGCGRVVEPDEQSGWTIDPAHVWPRGKGGCDHADCVLPACRFIPTGEGCHRAFDQGELNLLERVSERSESFGAELAHPIEHHGVTLLELVRRLTGNSHELVWVARDLEAA